MYEEIEKLVEKNDKFRLKKLFLSPEPNKYIQHFESLYSSDNNLEELNIYLSAFCMIYENSKLESIFKKFEIINFKFNSKCIYYLTRENNLDLLEIALNSASLLQKSLGEYLNPVKLETTLIRAIKNQNEQIVKILVENLGASIFTSDPQKRNPLYIASGLGNKNIVEYLIQKGADVNSKNLKGDTALLKACQERKIENVKLLVQNGADVNRRGFGGNSPLMTSVTDDVYHDDDESPSMKVFKFLLESNADIRLKNEKGASTFVRACGSINLKMVKILYEMLKEKYDNKVYIQNELFRGVENAIYYLRIENLEYLLPLLEMSTELNFKLATLLDFSNRNSLFRIYKRIEDKKKAKVFYRFFLILIRFNLNALSEDGLFYLRIYLDFILGDNLQDFVFIAKLVGGLVFELEKYGKIKLRVWNRERIEELIFKYGLGNLENLVSALEVVLDNSDIKESKSNSLVILSRNVVRDSMVSLSDNHINQLRLPNSLMNLIRA